MKKLILIIFTLFVSIAICRADDPEAGKYTISGHVKDGETGEDLLGATIYVEEIKSGTITNLYGFYSISLPAGNYNLIFSFVGYQSVTRNVNLQEDMLIDVELPVAAEVLKEVEIKSKRKNENVVKNEMSTIKMDIKTIREIPALMGEVDIIKAIQLLPGVQTVSEGGSGFSVRGGSIDQNLILLDEAPVYNASHLMGFFSVFNNDAIKDVKLYKGDIPASYGGRLSSVLDVRMKDGNSKKFSGTGGVGTISSRLTLEGPLQKDRASFIVSGRRTYADLFLRLSSNEEIRDNTLYFYDLNAKINYIGNENNRYYISAYYGKDIFKSEDFGIGWGNRTLTARWNHLFSKKLFSNLTMIYSKFDYFLGVPEGEANSFEWVAKLSDYGLKLDFNHYISANNTLKYGFSSTLHHFEPGKASGLGEETFFDVYEVQDNKAIESGVYLSNEQKIGALLSLKYGLRFSHFINVGETYIYDIDANYTIGDSTVYDKGEFFNPYFGLEPRIGAKYMLNEISSIKASYSRTRQYIHLAQNSTAGTPLDIWFPSSPNVKPQIADQYAIGYFRNFLDNKIEGSVETYYKNIDNSIDFKDHAELLLNREFEGELRFGKAWSYGLEFLFRFYAEKYNGFISYTLSRTEREIEEINNGDPFPAPFDKPHSISVVFNYKISKSFSVGGTWVYNTGNPVTFPTGRFEYGNVIAPVYSDRNDYRMPDYHRLDLSLTYKKPEDPDRWWHSEWNLSIYNVYNRKNAWVINFVPDENDPSVTYAEKTYLFGIVPSITYNFHF